MSEDTPTATPTRVVPWNGIGHPVDDAKSAADAIQAAGLDWDVEMRPVKYQFGNKLNTMGDKFVSVRTDTGLGLGVTGKEFVPLQNREAFDVLNDLVGAGELVFNTAGAIRGGKEIFITAKLPKPVVVLGSEGIDLYVMLTHGHTGLKGIRVDVTPVVLACLNMMRMAKHRAVGSMTVQHRASAKERLAQGAEVLGLMYDYAGELDAISTKLASVEMDEDGASLFLDRLYGDLKRPGSLQSAIGGTAQTWVASPNIRDDIRLTGWGAFNAVTEYWDHTRESRANEGPETRFRSTLEHGPAKHYRERALELLVR